MGLRLEMNRSKRDDLDILVERVLRDLVSDQAPPDRVWASIRLELQEGRRSQTKFELLRLLGTEIVALGADIVAGVGIMLTPSVCSCEEGWTERLVLAGHSSPALLHCIHH